MFVKRDKEEKLSLLKLLLFLELSAGAPISFKRAEKNTLGKTCTYLL